VPYRVDLRNASDDSLDRLVELGAIDAERSDDGGIAALMPDSVAPEHVASALGIDGFAVSPATARDAGSVWILSPRPIRIGRIRIVPAHIDAEPDALRLIDAEAFGTGLHPTTALCLEALDEAVSIARPDAVLDVGTGSGVLAQQRAIAVDPHDFLYQSWAYDAHDVGTSPGFGGDTAAALRSMQAEALVLCPPLDLFNPETAGWNAATTMANARYVEIPSEQGHQAATSLVADDAAFLNRAIGEFLSR